ncbi:MAG: Asp-tRNA(Asn)/Glu-tRNA(Gln) amidotransferase subunit GatA [Gemmatimonadaceae bacterium]|nr:Asp-tRNA(Asn)/Glu-tRNA(Gln) amidotransferase subunit GatA [Gemmatimonadaceae bacterium]
MSAPRESVPLHTGAAAALRAATASGSTSTADTVTRALARAREVKAGRDGLNIFVSLDGEYLDEHAETATEQLADTEPGLLLGVPVAIKDNIATLHHPTTCGSRILADYVSPYAATVVGKLCDAGAVPFGKTNMDEFAMGSSTENSAYGPTRNPVAPDRVPGGSSGGSAAAVAAGIVPVALGSETGGSVRQPASFCGVVGVKPTYGRVSRFGLVAFASSLDHVGVFGARVDDAARGLRVIAGHDPLDSTSANVAVGEYHLAHARPVKGMVVGRPREYFPDSLDPAVRARCDAAFEHLRELGMQVRDVSLPHTALAIPVYYIVAPAEASSNLARFDGARYGLRVAGAGLTGMYEATRSQGFGAEVTRRIMLGTYVLSAGYYDAYYRKAQRVRTLIAADFSRVFHAGVDVLFTPTTPTPAFKLGAISDPYEMYLSDIFTVTANLAGIPAMSQPIGRVGGLPIGGQLMAAHFEEMKLFSVAYALERALGAGASS